ncbi:RNA polymerase sigma factor [Pedobacter sp. SD-b]|uniref:RNA polymerase sigma factor n=1 Tax=Pedobacter segetis TaxID=2793069 RepID=A0ABS1BNA0_9SPHI|nr:RNA polymerase sigma factor [Pedobacter segetis]MBK0384377.1 RNA polymerase sigma factor [Pedobacter segetis]
MEATYIDKHFDLVVECKKGERKAHHDLYRLYSKAMYNVALRILNQTDEAEDALQDAFMEAFTKIKDFRQETTFGLWLKQIVVHKSINILRKRRAVFEDLEGLDVEVVTDYNWEDEEEIGYKIAEVKNSITLLPEGYRLVLSLYLLEGYDHEEISQILKISEGTSRTQFLRAKRKLLDILKIKGIER